MNHLKKFEEMDEFDFERREQDKESDEFEEVMINQIKNKNKRGNIKLIERPDAKIDNIFDLQKLVDENYTKEQLRNMDEDSFKNLLYKIFMSDNF